MRHACRFGQETARRKRDHSSPVEGFTDPVIIGPGKNDDRPGIGMDMRQDLLPAWNQGSCHVELGQPRIAQKRDISRSRPLGPVPSRGPGDFVRRYREQRYFQFRLFFMFGIFGRRRERFFSRRETPGRYVPIARRRVGAASGLRNGLPGGGAAPVLALLTAEKEDAAYRKGDDP